jgi:Na+-driven multidrug efflux pump
MQSIGSVMVFAFNDVLLKFSNAAVSVFGVYFKLQSFILMPVIGMNNGMVPIISYNYGAKNKDRVKGIFRLLLTCSLIYSVTVWAAVMLFPRGFASVFTSDAELLSFTEGALRIYCAVLGIFGIQIACQMTFVSLGKAVSSVTVAMMRKFVLLLPLIYTVPLFFGEGAKTTGVYLAEPIADVLAVTFTAILFAVQFKKALKSMDDPVKSIGE